MILVLLVVLTPFIFIPGLQDPSGLPKTFYISLLAIAAVWLLGKEKEFTFPISLLIFLAISFFSWIFTINLQLYLSQLSLDLSGIALCLYAANCLKSKDLPVAMTFLCSMGIVMVLSVVLGVQIDPRVSGPLVSN